jgi:hypothetical protein
VNPAAQRYSTGGDLQAAELAHLARDLVARLDGEPTVPFGARLEAPPLVELTAQGCDDLLVRLGHPRMMTRS